MSEVIVRPATAADGKTLLALIDGLADYESLTPPSPEGRQRLLKDLAAGEHFGALIAEVDGEAVGYSAFFQTYSTFDVGPKLYMEDLYVRPEFRSTKAGYALVRHLAQIATERGCSAIEWECLDWNELAQGFYERIGGRHNKEWMRYSMNRDAFRDLAGA